MATGKDIQLNFSKTPSSAAVDVFALDFPTTTDDNGIRTSDYVPLSNIIINNTGTTALKYRRNGQKGFKPIPAGVIFVENDTSISNFTIENASGASGAYIVALDNTDSQLSVLKDIRQKRLTFQLGGAK